MPEAIVASPTKIRYRPAMSDKQIALDTIQHLPETATLADITKRLEFVVAVREGLDEIERGETVPHEQIKRELAEWLTK
ncbi:hypothetical protein LBMAG56_45590 [Verrucomicrobiota bacterium]|nr:hypothetical protein LBMAG56_45590 [Verrucomicrobiota bacterium]